MTSMQTMPSLAMAPLVSAHRFRPQSLFRPESVAVLDADGDVGGRVMANLLASGFSGAVLPVAAIRSVLGVLAYPDIASLPLAPDIALVCGTATPELFAGLRERGCFAAIALAGGSGLRALAESTGVRSLGPYSFGIALPALGLNATVGHLKPRVGRLALVSQSASLCRTVLDWAEPNGVGFSHIVGIGSNDDIGFALVLDWLSRDPGTGAILLDIRLIKDSRAFLSAARAAARLRPVVAIWSGSRLNDPTGCADAVFQAALRRSGVLCVTRLEELLAAAETLTRAKPAAGETLAIVTNALGLGRMAADAALRDGVALAGEVIHAPGGLAAAALAVQGAGGVLVVHTPTGPGDAETIAALAGIAGTARAPVLVCALGETTGAVNRRLLAAAGVPVFASPEQAVRGFRHLLENRRNREAARELPPSKVLLVAPDRTEVQRLFARLRSADRDALTQEEALALMAAYGLPTVPSRAVADAEGAAEAATLLGFPAVLKRRRAGRPNVWSARSVALDLATPEAVLAAAQDLEQRRDPAAAAGFLVQRQVGRSRELRIHIGDDPVFGPNIVFGQGGPFAEALPDLAIEMPPLNLTLARSMISRSRVASTLGTLHDQPSANVEAIADALVRVSQMLIDFPEIAELDLNPLFVDAAGVMVGDAWVRLGAAGAPARRLAIPPYPAELTQSFESRGDLLTIRPIRPEDAEAHGALFSRLSPEDVRFRFFSALRQLSPDQMARMTQIDYDREMAFVVTRETPAQTVAVARLVGDVIGDGAEFAIVVQPDMKGRGVASALMRQLIDWGREHGLGTITGQVLADNAPMLAFMRHLGFTIRRIPDETGVVEATMRLAVEAA